MKTSTNNSNQNHSEVCKVLFEFLVICWQHGLITYREWGRIADQYIWGDKKDTFVAFAQYLDFKGFYKPFTFRNIGSNEVLWMLLSDEYSWEEIKDINYEREQVVMEEALYEERSDIVEGEE